MKNKGIRIWLIGAVVFATLLGLIAVAPTLADTTPPTVQYIEPPTPANNSEVGTSVNISASVTDQSDNVAVVFLNWGGENKTMSMIGDNTWSMPIENLQSGSSYTFKVYANDTDDNWAVSDTRIVSVIAGDKSFSIDFVAGYNMITLPRNDTSVTSASTMITKIGANCGEVSKWDSSTQEWKMYASGQPQILDFDIDGGDGCFVDMSGPVTIEFTGEGWESPFKISLVEHYNMIGIPVNDTSVTNASSLITKIGANCGEVSKWNSLTQEWKMYASGQPSVLDFDIGGGDGCFVGMTGPAEVTFEGEPWQN